MFNWGRAEWKKVAQIGSIVTGVLGTVTLLASAKEAINAFDPYFPATHGYVDSKTKILVDAIAGSVDDRLDKLQASLTDSTRNTQDMVRSLSTDILRTQIDQKRDSLVIKRGQRVQQSDLFARNSSDTLVKLQLDQMDQDIATDDVTLRAMVCELNKRLFPGAIC